MPRRDDIRKILLIGSGPIVIGQAAEFDYSGVQACKVLLDEGYEVVLVNSNPATIMTDPEFADRTYVEPLLPDSVARIVERERPDALLPTLGGQTALNLAKALHDDGTLDRFGVELIGADYEAIHRAEDREAFRATMEGAGLRVPWSVVAGSVSDAERELAEGRISLPAIVRPAFTLGGEGGGVARDREGIERAGAAIEPELEFRQVVSEGLAASPINQVLIEESVLGWGEFELEEIPNDITRATPASFEPTIDYVVTKIPRFAFEKFPGAEGRLSTHMKSVGEAMAIGRTFRESFAKAMRSRELDAPAEIPDGIGGILDRLETPSPDRYDLLLEAFRRGVPMDEVRERTKIDPWFLRELEALASDGDGTLGLVRTYRAVDTCAAEFEARTPYYYSAHERVADRPAGGVLAGEVRRDERPSIVILGSGPNRIGQGIEFDYCCVHAAMTVRESGRDAVMINCNPETVSTDYDTSDRLYFEPLTAEDVLAVVQVERPEGLIVQFGGQTPPRLPPPARGGGGPPLLAPGARRLPRGEREGGPGAPVAPGPLPRERDRGGRGCARRWGGRPRRSDHAARRGGRCPLGGLG